jgi:hypothetical protein
MYDIPFDRSFLQLSNGIRYVMPSTDPKPELTAKVSMAQPVSQPAVYANGLNQFLLTVVLSIEERVFVVEYVIREGNRYTGLVQEEFAEKFPETPVPHRNGGRGGAAKSAVYRDPPRMLNELKTAITVYITNISQVGEK